MKTTYFFILTTLLIATHCLYQKAQWITTFTNQNSQDLKADIWLLNLYDPYSYDSINFQHEFISASKLLHDVIYLGAINIRQQMPRLLKNYSKTPLLIYRRGKIIKYEGKLTAEAIIRFVKTQFIKIMNGGLQKFLYKSSPWNNAKTASKIIPHTSQTTVTTTPTASPTAQTTTAKSREEAISSRSSGLRLTEDRIISQK